jgi:hypothetical protein
MSIRRKIAFILVIVFIAIQFFQPAKNKQEGEMSPDFMNDLKVPQKVAIVLKTSCYDCHSNNTRYPWYTSVQPMGWFLAKHIKDGKEALNFNEMGVFSQRRQQSKLKAIHNSVRDGSMPLASYTLLHPAAKLSEEKKTLIMNWATKTANDLSTKK